jgi:hypothetical protein
MTRSARTAQAPALWLWSKRRINRARRCATRCDKRHSGVSCKLVQMLDAVCGARCRAHVKRLLHLASKQLVHPGCRRACSTAGQRGRVGERQNEAARPPLRRSSPSSLLLWSYFARIGLGQPDRDTDYSGLGAPITTYTITKAHHQSSIHGLGARCKVPCCMTIARKAPRPRTT